MSSPGVLPVSTPVPPAAIMPALVLLTLQLPPGVGSLRFIVEPAQTEFGPLIIPGKGLTVTVAVIRQPVGKVYVMVEWPTNATDPAVTVPLVDPTVATTLLLVLQVPPGLASLSVIDNPEQIGVTPAIGKGSGFTVTTVAVVHPVGNV